MAKNKYAFLIIGDSESGDHYHMLMENKPTDEQLSLIAHGWDGDDDKEGCGFDGSYVDIEVKKLEIVSELK
jgi:hypothetical protein